MIDLVQKVCIWLTFLLVVYSVTYTVHEKLCIGSKESVTVTINEQKF